MSPPSTYSNLVSMVGGHMEYKAGEQGTSTGPVRTRFDPHSCPVSLCYALI